MVKHGEVIKRTINVINLDPAAEHFDYPVYAGTYKVLSKFSFCYKNYCQFFVFFKDIRELITLDDAMDDKDLHFGPNGGLIFCME